VNLVRDQVAELHHIDVTNHHFLIESVARATVIEPRLAGFLNQVKPSFFFASFKYSRIFASEIPFENWRRDL